MVRTMAAAPTILSWMHSLSDITRARALRLLEHQELTVAELCAILQLPQSTVSRHLKILGEDGWVDSRREGTSRVYRMASEAGTPADPAAKRLWNLLREQTELDATAGQDDERLKRILSERQARSQAFFSSAAGQWEKMREDLYGKHLELAALPALLEEEWVIADLGCGTGQAAGALAPFVKRVIAVDKSAQMLKAARQRLKPLTNVEIRKGSLESLPIEDNRLDAAIISLVLHHLPAPDKVVAEAARALKPGGRLLIVDMVQHDRDEYRQQMGHVWLGFSPEQVEAWFAEAGMDRVRIRPLPTGPKAKGPALFVATGRRAVASGSPNGSPRIRSDEEAASAP